MEWKCILAVLFLVQYLDLSLGTATLKINMISFKNEKERDWHGDCCDPLGFGACDHLFTFCIDTATSGDQDYSSCHYFIKKTGEFRNQNENIFDGNMHSVANPIVRSFITWPSGGIKFKIRVDDDDTSHSSHDSVDRLRYQLNDTPKRADKDWQLKVITGFRSSHKTSASFKYKLYCDEYYFGSYCAIYCKAQNTDAAGHYTCHPTTGAKQCRPGWEGDDCKMAAIKAAGEKHCLNNGSCYIDNGLAKCYCTPGYTGEHCETNKCEETVCHNGGTCLDGKCQCTAGFSGAFCGLDWCERHPCHNGGTCSEGECTCTGGAHGRYCEFACSDETCDNDGTCVDHGSGDGYHCLCLPQFNGTHCEFTMPENSTAHNGAPLWIIGLVCALLFAIVIVILIAFLLVKRYRETGQQHNANRQTSGYQREEPNLHNPSTSQRQTVRDECAICA